MDIDELEINEIDEAPPQLDLTPEEIEELADELVDSVDPIFRVWAPMVP
jgi:hypothetical protein